MKFIFKNTSFHTDNKNRSVFCLNEIFFDNYQILKQSMFSNNMLYYYNIRRSSFFYFTKLKNRCILTGSPRSVNSKLRLSRIAFSVRASQGSLNGFYKSVW